MTEKAKINYPKTENKNSSKRAPLLKLLKVTLLLLVILVIVAGAAALNVVYSYVKDTPEFNPGTLRPALTSYIFDRNEVKLAELYDEQNRIEIKIETIPDYVINAFIAIEDERFYDHYGVDPKAIFRACIINLRQGDWTEQGGSTITQQLIKNVFLTPEKTFRRKVQEAWLSIKMESYYSKDEILEVYLNQIYFAHGAYGVEAAANVYFDKSVEELTLSEAAMLAGIPRSPNYYSPYRNPEVAMQRQSLVLSKMHELGFISNAALREARNAELFFAEPPSRDYKYPYFVDYVLHQEMLHILTSMPEYGSREEAYAVIYQGGLRVYTTLDAKTQQMTEDILNDESLYPQQTVRVDMKKMKHLLSESDYSSYPEEVIVEDGIPQPQSTAVVTHPVTGEVLALVGGREYSEQNQNLRYMSRRQPGSAAKPIFAYAPAIEENFMTPGSIIDDSPFVRGSWAPQNYGRRYHGPVTIREALVQSLNVPAIKTFEMITPKVGLEYAERMGISTIHPDDYNLATAIGGMTYGVTAFDMAQAFGVLANKGLKTKLHTVKRIEDASGNVIYEYGNVPDDVLSPQTAYLVTHMLKDAVHNGTASLLNVGRPVAGKTGTTSDNRDAYLVAYTPDLVVSFWMGHDMQKLGRIQGGSGSTLAFINQLIIQIMGDAPAVDFAEPPGISGMVSICSKSGLRAGKKCPSGDIVSEIFPMHSVPQGTCNLHAKKYTDYVHKSLGITAHLLYNPLRAHVSWDRGSEITEDQVLYLYRQTAGELTHLNTLTGSESQFLDNGLAEGKGHTYHLFAYNEEGVWLEIAVCSLKVSPIS